MTDAETEPTTASIDDYLASRASPEQLADCKTLMALLARVTEEKPQMWGPSIVGDGRYLKRLADVDVKVLETLVATSVAEVQRVATRTSPRAPPPGPQVPTCCASPFVCSHSRS